MSDQKRFSFTQPICADCYEGRYPGRQAARLTDPAGEVCCDCGNWTGDGIYIRADPASLAHPTLVKD